MRFALARSFVPQAAFSALAARAVTWWDEWVYVWGAMFDPEARKQWRAGERESLDADMIDRGWHGGFAPSSGGDEG